MWNAECHELGDMLYNCKQREKRSKEQEEQHGAEGEGIHANEPTPNGKEQRKTQNPAKDQPENMECEEKAHGLKQHHTTNSDSDGKAPSRCARMNPTPNLKGRRKGESLTPAADTPPST